MKSELQKMLAGEVYQSCDKALLKLRKQARLLTEQFNATSINQLGTRKKLLKQLFAQSGEHIFIEPQFNCDYGCNIELGDHFYANFGCVILDSAKVTIGEHCFLGPQVGIYTSTHPVDPTQRKRGDQLAKSITIGDNCWIGGQACILPGVSIGDNVVVGAGAVVTKNIPDNCVVAGNPAIVIKDSV